MSNEGVVNSQSDEEPPLVVDVDGTLLRTDLLVETALTAVRANPLDALRLPFWFAGGRARLKSELAKRVSVDPAALPYHAPVLATLRRERAAGRRIYLASASDRRYVETIAEYLGLFDGVFASDGETNLRSADKAQTLVDAFGEGGFDYIGNHNADLAVWERCRRVLMVDVSARVLKQATREDAEHEVLVPRRLELVAWLWALRPHQWLKNLLVFVPVAAAQAITPAAVGASLTAFVAFSLVASAVYVLNDLMDLASDRAHPRKSARPLASGAVPVVWGPALAGVLLVAGLGVGASVGAGLLAVLGIYVLATTAYSIYLKRKALLDVITLAGLYTLRVLGGAVAVGLAVSEWLLAFSMFLFLGLAIIKRHAELVDAVASKQGDPPGRGYQARDLPVLTALAAAAGYSAVLVLALYITTPQVQSMYDRPELLWGVCALLLFWVSNVLLTSHRGRMSDDPLIFAVKDPASLTVLALGALLVLAAA